MNNREQFGSYLLLKKLTEDPLGETFRAGKVGKQGMDRVVLLRVFNGQGIDAELLWRRVQGRAAIQQSLKNPNIGDGVDMGQVRGTPYVAYDYTSGKNLAAVLEQSGRKRQPIPFDHALLISERIALGLTVGYETRFGDERLLHGFLVPHLVLVSNEGETKLLGYEVSPALREVATTTAAREQFARYLAPETLAGQAPARSDDVYSLGVILFELLTGKSLPPPGAAGYNTIVDQAILFSEGTPLPAEIGALLKKSLAPRDQRFGDSSTWHKALGKLMADGHFNPTTFNLAFFMHNLFRDEIERETQEIAAEKKIQIAPPPVEKPAAPPPPPPAPRFGVKEETAVREELKSTSGGAAAASGGGGNKGMMIGLAAAAALLLGGGAYMFLNRGGSTPPPAAAPTPAPAPAPQPAAPSGPTPEELQAQIDKMIQERLQASEASLNKKYNDQLATLQKQLEDAKKAQATQPVRPASPPPSTIASAPAPAPVVPAPVTPPPAPTTVATTPAPAAAAPVPTPAAPAPAPPTPAPAPTVEVRLGDLVQMGPGVVPPRKLSMPNPRFPEIAKRANKTAVVTVSVLVDENGRAADVQLRDPKKAGFGFDEAAVDAARRATFQPATKNGVRVKMWINQAINFGAQ